MRWALWIVIGVIAAITWHYKYDDWAHALFVIWGIGLFYLFNSTMKAKVPNNVQKYILGFMVVVIFVSVVLAVLNSTR